jgi:HEPN domain-containing protein
MTRPANHLDVELNHFALKSFRNIADGDYIAARMACRAALVPQFLWGSQQAIEKYLKTILLLNRIPAVEVSHDLNAALRKINDSGKLNLDLTERTTQFIRYIDAYGPYRYLEVSHWAEGSQIIPLDQAVWELRRFCTLSASPRRLMLVEGRPAPRVHLSFGLLEKIIEGSSKASAREALLWQNGFFGRTRRRVRVGGWMHSENAPLALRPELLSEVAKYVKIPKRVAAGYRLLAERKSGKTS